MNLKKTSLTFLLALLVGAVAFAQKSETRTPGSFTKIENNGSWDVHVKIGSKDEVRLETSSFDLDKVITEIENGTLKIRLEKGTWKNVNLEVFVTVRELKGVGNGGSGEMILESDVEASNFSIGLSGSGSLTTQTITADKLSIGMSGSGKVTIPSGMADKVNVGQSGSGSLEALNFTADIVEIGKSGSGTTYIGVNESLTVGSSGSGNVYYRGNPEKQNIGVSGSTKVVKK